MMSRAGLKRIVARIAGAVLILIGIAGLVLPVIPGVVLIVAGLAVLSSSSRLAHRIVQGIGAWTERLRRRGNA